MRSRIKIFYISISHLSFIYSLRRLKTSKIFMRPNTEWPSHACKLRLSYNHWEIESLPLYLSSFSKFVYPTTLPSWKWFLCWDLNSSLAIFLLSFFIIHVTVTKTTLQSRKLLFESIYADMFAFFTCLSFIPNLHFWFHCKW